MIDSFIWVGCYNESTSLVRLFPTHTAKCLYMRRKGERKEAGLRERGERSREREEEREY